MASIALQLHRSNLIALLINQIGITRNNQAYTVRAEQIAGIRILQIQRGESAFDQRVGIIYRHRLGIIESTESIDNDRITNYLNVRYSRLSGNRYLQTGNSTTTDDDRFEDFPTYSDGKLGSVYFSKDLLLFALRNSSQEYVSFTPASVKYGKGLGNRDETEYPTLKVEVEITSNLATFKSPIKNPLVLFGAGCPPYWEPN